MFKKRFLPVLLLIVTATATTPGSAFIGNKLLGKKYCVVACGRGPLGIAPLGDAIAGANELMFGPTLDAFENKGKKIVDYAAARADERIKSLTVSLDTTLQVKLDALTELSQESISQLDTVLGNNINLLTMSLQQFLGSLDIVSVKTTDRLRLVIRSGLILFAVALLVIWVARATDDKPKTVKQVWEAYKRRALPGAVAAAFISLITIYFTRPELPGTTEKIERIYQTRMASLKYPEAAIAAAHLEMADPDNQSFRLFREKAELLRDVYYRPTTYKTFDGMFALDNRLESALIEQPADGIVDLDKPQPTVKFRADAELETTLAMLLWQLNNDDVSRMVAANISAHVIKRDSPNALAPLANYYLDSYLSNPLQDEEWAELQASKKSQSQSEAQTIFDATYGKMLTLSELRTIANKQQKATQRQLTDERSRLYSQITFGNSFATKYKDALSNYFWMVDANSCAEHCPAGDKERALVKRDEHAQAVVNAWEHLLKDDEMADLARGDLNLRLSLISSLHASYYRAKKYLASGGSVAIPAAITEPELQAIPDANLFHQLLVNEMRTELPPMGVGYLATRMKYQFLVDDQLLQEFESRMSLWRSTPNDWTAARAAGESAAKLGLVACISGPASDLDHVDAKPSSCSADGAEHARAIWLILGRISGDRPSAASWVDILTTSISRPIPLI